MLTAANPIAVCLTLARAISRTRTVDEIYSAALDALGSGLGIDRASILLGDPDGVMRRKACLGLSDAYRGAAEGHTPWTPNPSDPQPVLAPDVTREPALASLHLPALAAEGIAAMALIPLVSRGRVIGEFMLYFDEPHAPSGDELQLACVIAAQVACAVEHTRTEELTPK